MKQIKLQGQSITTTITVTAAEAAAEATKTENYPKNADVAAAVAVAAIVAVDRAGGQQRRRLRVTPAAAFMYIVYKRITQ